jgi:methionyl-tRNA formyltransferase
MKILFAGTPEFARQSLQSLLESGRRPLAVLTQPDRPAGRGKKIAQSAVKSYAEFKGLPVWQPATLKDPIVAADIAALQADVMVVAAYGLILPQAILDLPRRGCVNVHASLLPRWRGASPIQAAILAGDAWSGISLMRMEAGLDAGPVYVSREIPVGAAETAGELHDRLADLGGALLAEYLAAIVAGEIEPKKQDDAAATTAAKIRNADAALDWSKAADALERVVRAYNPLPGAWFENDGERVKCWSAVATIANGQPPGTVISADKHGVVVACAHGGLRMLELQRPGRKRISAAEFSSQQSLAGKRFA